MRPAIREALAYQSATGGAGLPARPARAIVQAPGSRPTLRRRDIAARRAAAQPRLALAKSQLTSLSKNACTKSGRRFW